MLWLSQLQAVKTVDMWEKSNSSNVFWQLFFFKRKILISPQVCFVHQLDSQPPFRRSSPSRQPQITSTICFSSVCSDTLELKNSRLASFSNTFLIDDHSGTEGIFLNHAVALNRAGVIFHCPDELWNASFIIPPRTYIHTVGFHFFIALLVGLLKSPLSWKWRNQINKTRWDASSQCPGPDEMESRWQSPTGKQI